VAHLGEVFASDDYLKVVGPVTRRSGCGCRMARSPACISSREKCVSMSGLKSFGADLSVVFFDGPPTRNIPGIFAKGQGLGRLNRSRTLTPLVVTIDTPRNPGYRDGVVGTKTETDSSSCTHLFDFISHPLRS